jgi:hypothetical protein
MLWVKTVAERMGDHLVCHHPTVSGVGKSAQAVNPTHGIEESLHASMMTILFHATQGTAHVESVKCSSIALPGAHSPE